MLPSIFQHLEMMVVLALFLVNASDADDVERSTNGDAGHFDDAADSKQP